MLDGCPACGASAPTGARFCGRCGAGLAVVVCPTCSVPNAWDHAFCSGCGAGLATGVRPAPARGIVLDTPTIEERKLATILFADVVGFTTLAEHADPEDVAHRVDAAFRRLAFIVENHGGRVDTYLGDGFMATFGVPTALGDEADRAVAAGLAIAAERPEDLRFSVGVNSGDVLVTSMGGATTVIGDAVNVAARLEKVAAAGQVLVGPTTAEMCGPGLRLLRRPAILVKGRATPVEVFEAVGQQQPPSSGPDALPVFGRENDLAFLLGQWRRTVDEGRPAIVVMTGEPGIGKTRLLDHFIDHARCDGAHVVKVTYPAYGGLAGPQVGAEVARQLGLSGDPTIDEPILAMADKLDKRGDALVPPGGCARATAAAVPGSSPDADAVPGVVRDPETLFVDQVFAFRRLAEARSQQGPLLVVLDDVHRSTDRLLEMLARINAQIGPVPVLTVLVGRPGDGRWMAGFPSASVLRVGPVGATAARQLVDAVAPGLEESHADAVLDRAGGSPLFLRELAAMVAAGGSHGAPLAGSTTTLVTT